MWWQFQRGPRDFYAGQGQVEHGAFADLAGKGDVAGMAFDDGFDKDQAETDAILAWLIGRIQSLKAVE